MQLTPDERQALETIALCLKVAKDQRDKFARIPVKYSDTMQAIRTKLKEEKG